MTVEFVEYRSYEAGRGELTDVEHQTVVEFNPSPQDIELMKLYMHRAFLAQGLDHLVSESDCVAAARIKGALGDRVPVVMEDQRFPNWNWLLTEAYILQGKDPDEIFEAQLPGY